RETWAIVGVSVASLDQPRTVDSSRLRFSGNAVLLFMKNQKKITCTVVGVSQGNPPSTQCYALKNVLFNITSPTTLQVIGIIHDNVTPKGVATLTADLRFILPFLPDPYATDMKFKLPSEPLGTLQIKLRWQPKAPVTVDVVLPASIMLPS